MCYAFLVRSEKKIPGFSKAVPKFILKICACTLSLVNVHNYVQRKSD